MNVPSPVVVGTTSLSRAVTHRWSLAGSSIHRPPELGVLHWGDQVIIAPTVWLDIERRDGRDRRQAAPRLLVLDPFVRLYPVDENLSGEVARWAPRLCGS